MKLQFIAARHYASRGHWDDAYAYVLRSQPDDVSQHEDTYNRNAQAWHYTYARINEIIQEAEQALTVGDKRLTQGVQSGPPRDFPNTSCTFYWSSITIEEYPRGGVRV